VDLFIHFLIRLHVVKHRTTSPLRENMTEQYRIGRFAFGYYVADCIITRMLFMNNGLARLSCFTPLWNGFNVFLQRLKFSRRR
jgi:hypothetical protein